MAENKTTFENTGHSFKEACCIDAGRVYDSCCNRDCLEDLRCFFTAADQATISNAINVKMRSAEVLTAYIDVEPVNFNRGFYACNITFFFIVKLDVYMAPHTCPVEVSCATCYNKQVILFGSDGNVKVFASTTVPDGNCGYVTDVSGNKPRCVAQCVDPVPLNARLGEVNDTYDNVCIMPDAVETALGAPVVTDAAVGTPTIYVTLGLFTVIQLTRQVQMLIPVYDFCIPEKQREDTEDEPCDIFKRIKFPTEDFFPPRSIDNNDIGCHSNK